MIPLDPDQRRAAAIRNAAYFVRHYPRRCQREQREQAIRALGLIVRATFNESENFEVLLVAIVDGLRPRPEPETPF